MDYIDETPAPTSQTNEIHIPAYEMITPISMDYRTWDLEPEQMSSLVEARKDAGIHRIDTWSFDQFICGAIVNGLIHTELTAQILSNPDAWANFKAEHPKVQSASFEDAITFIATALSQYHKSHEGFIKYRGKDVLIEALETFLEIFPHLTTADESIHGRTVLSSADDYLDIDQGNSHHIERNYLERELFAVSWSDSVRLDDHLAGVFAIGFKILSENTHTHPIDLSYDEWTSILGKISDGFKNYHLYQTPLDEQLKEIFVSRFSSFWD